eukprot:1154939-Pelagomonas_calceolata.AAC.11
MDVIAPAALASAFALFLTKLTACAHVRAHTHTHLQLVGDQDAGAVAQQAADALIKQVAPDMGVHSTEGVIQQVQISSSIGSARECHSVLLAA